MPEIAKGGCSTSDAIFSKEIVDDAVSDMGAAVSARQAESKSAVRKIGMPI